MLTPLNEYIRSIGFFLIFITFIGIILPGSKFKNYINLILGLVLIIIILNPLTLILRAADNKELNAFNLLPDTFNSITYQEEGEYYSQKQRELIEANLNHQLKPQISGLLEAEGYEVTDVTATLNDDLSQIASLTLSLTQLEEKKGFIRIEKIEPVNINVKGEAAEKIDSEEIFLKNIISDFYNLPEENIYISVRKKKER